jgi:hypothetical protein
LSKRELDTIKQQKHRFDLLINSKVNVSLIEFHGVKGNSYFPGIGYYWKEKNEPLSFENFDTLEVLKSVVLDNDEIRNMSNVIFNTNKGTSSRAACYSPHHGVKIYNDSNDVIAFIEICFSCRRIKYYGQIETPKTGSKFRLEALRKLFKQNNFTFY